MPRDRLVRAAALVAVVSVLGACGDGDPRGDDDSRADDELARGEQLYTRHCVSCHGGATGGEIGDLPPRHNAQGHTWHHPDCMLVDIVLEGMPPRDGQVMPAFDRTLDEDDVDAILAYIRTWWEPDQREFQAEITEANC